MPATPAQRSKYDEINALIEAALKELQRLRTYVFDLEEERARIALEGSGVHIGDTVMLTGSGFKGSEALVVDATQRRVRGECLSVDTGIDQKPHIIVEVPGTRARAFHVSGHHWERI